MTDAPAEAVKVAVVVRYKELRHAEVVARSLAVDKDLKGCVHHSYRSDPTNNTMIAFAETAHALVATRETSSQV